MSRFHATALAALAAAALAAGCGSAAVPVSQPQPINWRKLDAEWRLRALAYMRTHPVPQRGGMIAGVVTDGGRAGGNLLDGTGVSWTLSLLTPSGRTVTARCTVSSTCVAFIQSVSAGVTDDGMADGAIWPFGAYLYVPASGLVRDPGEIRAINWNAVP